MSLFSESIDHARCVESINLSDMARKGGYGGAHLVPHPWLRQGIPYFLWKSVETFFEKGGTVTIQ